ncbi:MAG: TonB-dependent receptor family protein, partial [Saprospiraceae bacterium]|nr:TonB-dependent receptor family protein [Saprospiraceae bacterium]
TNPSAKYDAGGSTAGIVNIVLKKEKRLGYNGSVRTGADVRGGYNLGGDINAASEKTNLFLSGNLNQRKGFSTGETFQQNLTGSPLTSFTQIMDNQMQGVFANVRGGLDWFLDNRNTLTFSSSYTRGSFNPNDVLTTHVDSMFSTGLISTEYIRTADQNRNFKNLGGSILFKHLFPKQGSEWTADINYNRVRFLGGSNYITDYLDRAESLEKQDHEGNGQFITIQSDLVQRLSPAIKIETGIRAALRRNSSDNSNQYFVDGNWESVDRISDHYRFNDDVYAAYATLSHEIGPWGYQVGLRGESSFYEGTLTGIDSSFNIDYPISLFPSVFLTRKLKDGDNLQLSYTRRVNRPNFFQTMPFTDISNALNPRRGNPQLKPEFTNALELSYQKLFAKGDNLLFSLYYKQATDLITAYLTEEYVEELGQELVLTTFTNSNSSYAYGGEITLKNTLLKNLDLTSNVNIYQSALDATNVESSLNIDRVSWFLKEQLSIRMPAGFTLQLSGEYRSKASFTPSTDSRMPWGPQTVNTAQGYTLANWFVDAALRKDLLNRKASLTLNINDIFRSRKSGTYTISDLFIQESYRTRDPQIARLNFSYRFGKADTSLFKRKNMNQSSQGNDMMN